MTAILLCAGDGNRWKGPYPKQMVQVNGRYLIQRTAEMALLKSESLVVMVKSKDRAMPCFAGLEEYLMDAAESRDITLTLHSSRLRWKGSVVVLLGDVLYSDWAAEELFTPRDVPYVLGTGSEIFGLSFPESLHDYIINLLNICGGCGAEAHLCHLWRLLAGLPIHQHWKTPPTALQFFHYQPTNDITRDFDHFKDYQIWQSFAHS